MKYLLFIIFSFSFLYSKSYTVYFASTKYLDVAKEYYHDIRFHTPDFYDVIIRTHEKENFSVIVRHIPTIEKAKKIQKLLKAANKYTDSYIKRFEKEPSYDIIEVKDKLVLIKLHIKPYKQDVELSNEYLIASTMYNTKQYKKSYEMFFKLFLENNYNLNINYFLAQSAFNIKKYDEAIAAFERVLMLKPNFNQARYDFARVLFMLKQKNQAKEEFEKLLTSNINAEIKTKIKSYLEILNRGNKKNKKVSGTANLMFGVGRSSNVNNGLISPEYRLPGLNDSLVEGEKPIADSFHFEMINLNFYNYFKSYPMRLKNSFLIYNRSFINEKDENITVFSYKPSVSYSDRKNKNNYEIELGFDKIIKNTNEDFYAFSISPKLIKKDFYTYLKYQRIMYKEEEDEDKDFDKIQLYSKINLFKNFNYYVNVYQNRRIETLRTDIDKYTIANGFNLFYYINNKNKINLNYQFDYSKYKYDNIGFNTKRKDKYHSVNISLNYNINKTNAINLSSSYIKNYSNQEAYLYDEKAINLYYLKSFLW